MRIAVTRVNYVADEEDKGVTSSPISIRMYLAEGDNFEEISKAINRVPRLAYFDSVTEKNKDVLVASMELEDLIKFVAELRSIKSLNLSCCFLSAYIYVSVVDDDGDFYDGTYDCIDDIIEEVSDECEPLLRVVIEAIKAGLDIDLEENPSPVYK